MLCIGLALGWALAVGRHPVSQICSGTVGFQSTKQLQYIQQAVTSIAPSIPAIHTLDGVGGILTSATNQFFIKMLPFLTGKVHEYLICELCGLICFITTCICTLKQACYFIPIIVKNTCILPYILRICMTHIYLFTITEYHMSLNCHILVIIINIYTISKDAI